MTMKQLAVCGIAAWTISLGAFGQQPPGPGQAPGGNRPGPSPEKFQAMKAEELKMIQARIQLLQQAQACVQGASDPGQLKQCNQKTRETQEQLRQQRRSDMESMRGGRKAP